MFEKIGIDDEIKSQESQKSRRLFSYRIVYFFLVDLIR